MSEKASDSSLRTLSFEKVAQMKKNSDNYQFLKLMIYFIIQVFNKKTIFRQTRGYLIVWRNLLVRE